MDVYEQNGINSTCKKEIARMDVNQYDLIPYENVSPIMCKVLVKQYIKFDNVSIHIFTYKPLQRQLKKTTNENNKTSKKEDFCPTQIRMFLTNPYKY